MITAIFLSILSGAALVFAFPPFAHGALAWVALVPLFIALDGLSARGGFASGFVAGAAFNLGAIYWVVHSMHNYGGLPLGVAVVVMLALVAYMALYWGVFGLLFAMTRGHGGLARLVVVPAFWVALEYARGYLLTGFPWVLVGYTQAAYPPLIQIAEISGVWSVSFVVVAFNASVAFLAAPFFRGARPGKAQFLPVAVCAAVVAAVFVYGLVRMGMVDREAEGWPSMKVAVAQGSIDQGVKWDGRYQQETVDIYGALTARAAAAKARLVVWPETAMPFHYDPGEVSKGVVGGFARKGPIYILTGSPSYNYNPESKKVSYFNSAFLIDPLGATVGRYDKFHLVPFGEYLPLRGILPLDKLTAGIGDFTPGKGPVPITYEDASIGTLVCFESIFPEIAGAHVRNGADLLVTVTNDAWFGRTSAPYQHLQMAALRAVETRAFLVRSANTGISAFIDPNGRIREKTGLFERTIIVDEVRLRRGPLTFYSMYGDIFAWGAVAVSAAACLFWRRGLPGSRQ